MAIYVDYHKEKFDGTEISHERRFYVTGLDSVGGICVAIVAIDSLLLTGGELFMFCAVSRASPSFWRKGTLYTTSALDGGRRNGRVRCKSLRSSCVFFGRSSVFLATIIFNNSENSGVTFLFRCAIGGGVADKCLLSRSLSVSPVKTSRDVSNS